MTRIPDPKTLVAEEGAKAERAPFCLACSSHGADRPRVCHRTDGAGRLACAEARLAETKRRAAPSPFVSPLIKAAPARGPMKVLRQTETVLTPNGPRQRPATMDGFHAAVRADAFDLMQAQAKRRKPDAPALFTAAQVQSARTYAALAERVAAEGVRCSSLDGRIPGASEGSWIDGVIGRSDRLDRMRAAIGNEVVLSPRDAEAHADRGRRVLRTGDLVDQVCSHGHTVGAVLRRAGWARNAKTTGLLKAALASALDRLWGL